MAVQRDAAGLYVLSHSQCATFGLMEEATDDMVFGGNGAQGWLLANDLNSPGGTNSTLNKIFFENLLHDVATKKASAGGAFNVTFGSLFFEVASSQSADAPLSGDYWARALRCASLCTLLCSELTKIGRSYHFLTGTTNETFFSNTSAGNHAATLSLSQATSLCVPLVVPGDPLLT